MRRDAVACAQMLAARLQGFPGKADHLHVRTVRILALTLFFGTLARVQPGEVRIVEYDVDGTATYANVTWNAAAGATEQKQLKLPVHESFRLPLGELAYVSAQKVRVTRVDPSSPAGNIEVLSDGVHGTVHVTIHINWKLASEATADAPFGIAKASAKVD
jgi:hypothetical protein